MLPFVQRIQRKQRLGNRQRQRKIYSNNNYSRDWIFEKEFRNEKKELNWENSTEQKDENYNQNDDLNYEKVETNERDLEDNHENESAEENFNEKATSRQ